MLIYDLAGYIIEYIYIYSNYTYNWIYNCYLFGYDYKYELLDKIHNSRELFINADNENNSIERDILMESREPIYCNKIISVNDGDILNGISYVSDDILTNCWQCSICGVVNLSSNISCNECHIDPNIISFLNDAINELEINELEINNINFKKPNKIINDFVDDIIDKIIEENENDLFNHLSSEWEYINDDY